MNHRRPRRGDRIYFNGHATRAGCDGHVIDVDRDRFLVRWDRVNHRGQAEPRADDRLPIDILTRPGPLWGYCVDRDARRSPATGPSDVR